MLVDAAAGLRAELQAAGSDLVVRTGQASFYLPALCAYAGIKTVVVQEEGEARCVCVCGGGWRRTAAAGLEPRGMVA